MAQYNATCRMRHLSIPHPPRCGLGPRRLFGFTDNRPAPHAPLRSRGPGPFSGRSPSRAFIIVSIRYGIFTPTEAGAITVIYTALVGFFAYGDLKLAHLPGIIRDTVLDTSAVMLLICAAAAFGFYMSWEALPPKMAAWLLHQEPMLLLLFINLLLIVLGTAVESTAALIILTPILVPVVVKFEVDPVHFGIMLVMSLTLAGVTPPSARRCSSPARSQGPHGELHGRGPAVPGGDVRDPVAGDVRPSVVLVAAAPAHGVSER